jgi:predicted ferric reductase
MTPAKSTKIIDWLVLFASILILGLSAVSVWQSGMLSISLAEDAKLSWHLVRSAGIVSYLLLLASMVWGLFMSAQCVKDWSPGAVSMTLHSTLSWLAVMVGLVHALLLLLDDYFTYTLADLFVPFVGPYRPEAVGLGTLAFWILLIVTLSFPLKKRLGHANWKRLHYLSYAAFVMVSLHGLFAGTDGSNLGFRLLLAIGVLLVVALTVLRVRRSQRPLARVTR